MSVDPRYAILFEPLAIGPVTAPNRFYQTPHATGMGSQHPHASIAFRRMKAEGGWGVVCTEYCSIHPSSDDAPFGYLTLWDEEDQRFLAAMTEAIHGHGSLAGIELWHGGSHTNNRLTREPLLAPSETSACYLQPGQARTMDKADIVAFRGWHRQAALRARAAGFDIVYVYAGHDYLPFQFLSPRSNRRSDEYGGSVENRMRFLRELIEDTKDAVGDTCAVAVRLSVDELKGPRGITSDGEARVIVAALAELPDLWDVNLAGGLANDSLSSRFSEEGFQEDHVAWVKGLTAKPVVSVGRFTSPDAMAGQIRRGVQDFIGAARPSIADPFLPRKIAEGRLDEIRECIGCNICRSSNNEGVPLRCTQNPTVGEEWRRGWHPEKIPALRDETSVLVVGAGPAGLEAAVTLGRRGLKVMLAEATRELGGRVLNESRLPGLSKWIRVRDHRVQLLEKLDKVEIFRESRLTAEDVLSVAPDHVAIATGSSWRRDGLGAMGLDLPEISAERRLLTPDDVFAGTKLAGHIVLYDDEHYSTGGALAEKFLLEGQKVTLVTPAAQISAWAQMTDEQFFIQKRLLALGLEAHFANQLTAVTEEAAVFECIYTGRRRELPYDHIILTTGRLPVRKLYDDLAGHSVGPEKAGIKTLTRIGDCLVPSSIADAVFRGHKYGREFESADKNQKVRRERPLFTAFEGALS
jgi:dimethylamine/trimethylamine dehydrogenase